MTLPSSTTSTAGSVTLDPTSPARVSTVRTSSTAAFSCLPPQRTIAYTEELSLCLCGPIAPFRPLADQGHEGGLASLAPAPWQPSPGSDLCAGSSGYQTPAAADASGAACPGSAAMSGGPGSRVAARRRRRPPNGCADPVSAGSPAPLPGTSAAPWLAAALSAALASAPAAAAVASSPVGTGSAGLSSAGPSLSGLPCRCRRPSLPVLPSRWVLPSLAAAPSDRPR